MVSCFNSPLKGKKLARPGTAQIVYLNLLFIQPNITSLRVSNFYYSQMGMKKWSCWEWREESSSVLCLYNVM